MSNRLLLGIACILGLFACEVREADCADEQVLQINVSFYPLNSTLYEMPIDTAFTSVYAVGAEAEMRNRRVNNSFYLPVPARGGEVLYVFEQGEMRDTLALDVELGARFRDTDCPAEVRLEKVSFVAAKTSYTADQLIVSPRSYGYEATVSIRVP